MRRLLLILLAGLLLTATLTTTAQRPTATALPDAAEATAEAAAPVELLKVEVVAEYPHDANAYTQGLLLHDGMFYESAGQYGESDVRRVDPETGEVQQQMDVPEQYFAEGLALVDDRLLQITWKEETALVYDLDTFEPLDTLDYEGEGWGLCYDGAQLIMSDGTETLTLRDPDTFEATGTLTVMLDGEPLSAWSLQGAPLSQLNELECVGDWVYANVWYTDVILKIEAASGVVTAVIFAGDLLPQDEWLALRNAGGVLNGIAYNAEADTFYITGKLWPKLFEVRFVPAE